MNGFAPRDANHVPLAQKGAIITKTVSLDGTTGNGKQGTIDLFTFTGDILIALLAVCTADLVGATATLEVGIAGNTAALIAQSTGTNITNGTVWTDATLATVKNYPTEKVLTGGGTIIATVGTADITAGDLTFYALVIPLSTDGNLS